MKLNDTLIPHYRSQMIPLAKLKNKVSINEALLREKPTWYEIDDRLQYFKIRNDFRLFGEFFFSLFATQIMDLQALEYHLSFVRTEKHGVPQSEETTKCGLLSDNFQDRNYNHYLVSELMQAEVSAFIAYGGYNLKSLLAFFKDYLAKEDYTQNELFLIKLFISDAYTFQVDRNPNNIAFQIPRIKGVSYSNRLYPQKLAKLDNKDQYLEYDQERESYLLKGFMPNVVFDSERILGIDHKDVLSYSPGSCWKPLFPYDSSLDFHNMEEEQVAKIQKEEYEGMDPNLLALYCDHQKVCQPFMERLAYDDEYRKILEQFNDAACPITLSESDLEYVNMVIKDRQKAFKRILKF